MAPSKPQVDPNILRKVSKRQRTKKSIFNDVSTRTLYASSVLVIAIAVAVTLNQFQHTDPLTKDYLQAFCQQHYCDKALSPSRRTQLATQPIPKGRKLVEIPRDLQIWSLDALRDQYIRNELFKAKLPQDAYLAAFLAIRVKKIQQVDDLHAKYINLLPKYTDFAYHPVLWSDEQLDLLLGQHTYACTKVKSNQRKIRNEYDALVQASADFGNTVTFEDYLTAKLNVMTRSFGTGPIPESEALEETLLQDELQKYQHELGIDLSQGAHAMVPVLDFYDSHPKPHVEYKYDGTSRSFVVETIRPVAAGSEVFDSYGLHSDGHLFANYGFVNADGSSHTQVSLALMHDLEAVGEQRLSVVRYLLDDGYESCVDPSQVDAWNLRKYKFLHLLAISNDLAHWTVTVKPRSPDALPGLTSDTLAKNSMPKLNMEKTKVNPNRIYSTCRLIVLKEEDFDGEALKILQDNLSNATNFFLPRTDGALEYRTMWCTFRLVQSILDRFPRDLAAQESLVRRLNLEGFQTAEWVSAHVALGEQQILEALKTLAISGATRFQEQEQSSTSFTMRNEPCPPETQMRLVNEALQTAKLDPSTL